MITTCIGAISAGQMMPCSSCDASTAATTIVVCPTRTRTRARGGIASAGAVDSPLAWLPALVLPVLILGGSLAAAVCLFNLYNSRRMVEIPA